MVGHFPHKFSIAAAKLLIESKKLGGAKMVRTSSCTVLSMVGIVGRAPAVDESVMFYVCLSVTLWNYGVCNNRNAMKQCNFQINYGTNCCVQDRAV